MQGEVLKLIIPGRPATKKNNGRIVMRGKYPRLLPSKAFEKYEKVALRYIRAAMPGQFRIPVTMQCRYWMPDRRGWPDLVGLLQATSDILEVAGVLENDRLIVDYDGSRIVGIDKDNPRTEIIIKELGADYQSPDPYVRKKSAVSLFG